MTSGYRPVFPRPDEALRQPNQSKDCLQEVGGAETAISMVFSDIFWRYHAVDALHIFCVYGMVIVKKMPKKKGSIQSNTHPQNTTNSVYSDKFQPQNFYDTNPFPKGKKSVKAYHPSES